MKTDTARMGKKQYELFANEIYQYTKDNENAREMQLLINVCSRIFKADNPLFKEEKFYTACNTGKHIRKAILTV